MSRVTMELIARNREAEEKAEMPEYLDGPPKADKKPAVKKPAKKRTKAKGKKRA